MSPSIRWRKKREQAARTAARGKDTPAQQGRQHLRQRERDMHLFHVGRTGLEERRQLNADLLQQRGVSDYLPALNYAHDSSVQELVPASRHLCFGAFYSLVLNVGHNTRRLQGELKVLAAEIIINTPTSRI